MSIADDEVHTPTLRWLADRHERVAEYALEQANRGTSSWTSATELEIWRAHIRECRTLRSLATRIDNKRKKAGAK